MRRYVSVLGILFCAFLSACGPDDFVAGAKLDKSKVWLEEVQFNVAKNMNNNTPCTVAVVIAYDGEVLKMIGKLTAEQFFTQEPDLLADNGDKFEVFKAELVPGQKNDPMQINPKHVAGLGCIIFARYTSPGPHKQVLGPDRIVELIMKNLDFKVRTVKP